MLDMGVISPGRTISMDMPAGDERRPRALVHAIVPNSGIQFIDFEIGDETVAHTRRRFLEEVTDGESSLHVAASDGGVIYHPLTNVPCDPASTFLVGGSDALEPFLGRWLPVPYMRVSRTGEDDALMLDEGPSNWTRVHVTRRAQPAGGYHVVLAIDSGVEHDAARASRGYVAPTLDDLKAGAPFRFSDDVNDIAWFVSEAWVDEWVKTAHDDGVRENSTHSRGDTETRPLQHLASYLTLLGVLREGCELPALRFLAPNSVGAYAETVPVDLSMDLGTSRTTVLIEERVKGGRDEQPASRIRSLPLRELSTPWRVSDAPFTSRIAFARADFGSEALSRWSGRANAFYWPSTVRVGSEAAALGMDNEGAETLTGVSSPAHYVWDERPSRHVWRFASTTSTRRPPREGETRNGERRNPVVSGTILAHLTESGDLIEDGDTHAATTKPRFSRSALVTLQVAEILLHSISAINAPATREVSPRPETMRRLDRIFLTPSAAMSDAEIAILRRRLEAAVKLVWRMLGWDVEAHPLAPPPPTVVIAVDAGTASQLAYLENEIAHKFRGKAANLLGLIGRPRPGFQAARTLRIATLDIGAATSSLSVATYEPAPGNGLAVTRQLVDGFDTGCDTVEQVLARRTILAALEHRLAECRHGDTKQFINALLGPDDRGRPAWVGDIGRRLAAELLAPAAAALLRLYASSDTDAGDAPAELTIGALIASIGADARVVADRLDVAAADEGADGFSPLDVVVPYLMREVGRLVRDTLRPMLDSTVRVLAALDCDLVLLSGRGATLPAVRELILSGIPLRPDRVLAMHDHRFGPWFPGHGSDIGSPDTKLLPAVGALVQARGAIGNGGPEIVLRPIERGASAVFFGKLRSDGRLDPDDVLFDLAAEPGISGQRSSARETPAAMTRAVTLHLPALIGMRITSLASSPARPQWIIERSSTADGRPPKMPARVTLELTQPGRGRPPELKLITAVDSDGGRIDNEELVLRLQTRRHAAGHWLDTGHLLAADRTETAS